MPQISVIVPVYNVEKYLHRCVDSILAQTFRYFELILVNDGSPDNCGAICDEYAAKDSRVHVIHQKNRGPASARNAGLEWAINKSKCEWITFVDADDWIHKQYLEILIENATKKDVLICMCDVLRVNQYSGCESRIEVEAERMSAEKAFAMNLCSMMPVAKMIHRSVLYELRFPDGKFAEDVFTMYKVILSNDNAVLIDTPLYYYYQNTDSVTNKQWTPKMLDEIEGLEEMIAYFRKHDFELAFRRIARAYCYVLSEHIRQIQNTENLQYKEHLDSLRCKLRRALREYRFYIDGTFREKACLFEGAYPTLVDVYWKCMAICEKIKRFAKGR